MGSKKKQTAAPSPDLPVTEVTLGGKTYKACFDFRTLIESEQELFLAGHDVNLMEVFPRPSASNLCILLAVALQRFHRDIPYAKRLTLMNGEIPTFYLVSRKLNELWLGSMPEAKEGDIPGDPPQGGPAAANAGSESSVSDASS